MNRKIRNIIIIFITSLYSIISLGQDQFFEGVIEFDHIIIPKDSTYDVNYDYRGIGTSSTYYYKKGNLMFQNNNGYFEKSIFRSKYNRNFYSDENILNYECKVLTINLKPKGKEFPRSTRRYFFPKSIIIDGSQFEECYGSFHNLVYGKSNSVPLRIEYEWPNRIVKWQTKSITNQEIDSKIFEIDGSTILQQIN